jgi:hypothetical protein
VTDASIHDLLAAITRGEREVREDALRRILKHVANAGFDSNALERVRGRLAGISWQESVLTGADRLSPAVVHYLWHVIKRREWPTGTTLPEYLSGLREVVLDPSSGVVAFKYQGAPQLGVFRESDELRGPMGQEWVLVQYRVSLGH